MNNDAGGASASNDGLGVMVACSKGTRLVAPGMRWRDLMTGSEWEVVEPVGTRVYSPSGFGGTPEFWCRAVGDMPLHATHYAQYARDDGCVAFCGDSIAAMLLTPNQEITGAQRPVDRTLGVQRHGQSGRPHGRHGRSKR